MKSLLLVLALTGPSQEPIKTLYPKVSQESINQAIKMYNIQVPSNTAWPVIDFAEQNRGLATYKPNSSPFTCLVTVGPSAFSSWGVLGSTLAHELEGHCSQNLFLIGLTETELLAEQEAYSIELSGVDRFKLTQQEVQMIQEILVVWYSDQAPSWKKMIFNIFVSAHR